MFNLLKSFYCCFSMLIRYLMVSLFLSAVLIFIFQFFLRFFFQSTFYWTGPLSQNLFVMACLFGSAYGIGTNENIKIEIARKIGKKSWVRKIINLFSSLINLLMIWVFFLYVKTLPEITWLEVLQWTPLLLLFFYSMIAYLYLIYRDAPDPYQKPQ